jgi:glycosyltransferase involved in cell wall biosynthesis
MSLISVVVPLYNEEGNVAELIRRVTAIMERVCRTDTYEIVAVNDGSRDATLGSLRRAQAVEPHLVIVDLSRNFGHQIAATAGLDTARGDAVVLMDGDLQDPPELIEAFVQKWRDGYDVVYATRKTRKGESFFKLLTAKLFYRTIRRLTNVSIPVDTGDFRLMSRRVVDALGQTREKHRFLRGLVSWVGYQQIGVEYERDARTSGETKYPFSKMLKFAIDGITSFSEIPLRFATYLGFFVSVAAFLYAAVVLVLKLLGLNEPGYTSIMVVILFLGGVQLVTIGIAGEYLGRIYDQVKARPLYLLSSVERSDPSTVRAPLPVYADAGRAVENAPISP